MGGTTMPATWTCVPGYVGGGFFGAKSSVRTAARLGSSERQGWGIGLRLDPGGHDKKPQMIYA
jgi:hypothetical protein